MLPKDEPNNIQTTLYRKPTDQKAFLNAMSEPPRSLTNSIFKQFAQQRQNTIRIVLLLNWSF